MRLNLKKDIEELRKAAVCRITDKVAAKHDAIEYDTTIGYALAHLDQSPEAQEALKQHLSLLQQKKAAIEAIKAATTGSEIENIVDEFCWRGDVNV
jgi:mannitol/fructose-specific phosphotransferase system IIA component (Ntr-type)